MTADRPEPRAIAPVGIPPAIGPYSPALAVGDWILLSGRASMPPDPADPGSDTIERQTEQTLRDIETVLAAAGASLSDVVSCLAHLSDLTLFDRFNAVYGRFFAEPLPVRTTVGAALIPGLLVELTVTARRPLGLTS